MEPLALMEPVAPMEMRQVAEIPRGPGWQYEPKWDGFRCIASRHGEAVELWAKSGQPLARYFPEVVDAVRALPARQCVLDGELVVPSEGRLDFDALQQRIHPAASRVARLARETPAWYMVFDALALEDHRLLDASLAQRRTELEAFARGWPPAGTLRLSPATRDAAVVDAWFSRAGGALDGVVAKRLDRAYAAGKRDAAVKIKPARTADCVVAGFRYAANDPAAVGSLLLGLYDVAGRLDYVGFTSAFSAGERRDLLVRVRPLCGPPSFTGRAPGGPSRWNHNRDRDTAWVALRPELVLEVAFDQATGARFRHGTRPLRWRADKTPRQCTLDQLEIADRTVLLVTGISS